MPDPATFLSAIIIFLLLILLIKTIIDVRRERPNPARSYSINADEDTEDDNEVEEDENDEDSNGDGEVEPAILRAINSAQNAEELMDVARMMENRDETLYGEEDRTFHKKAMLFKGYFDNSDWEIIRDIAEQGSELEEEAESRI